MENRIKEQQLDLFADRTSTHWMASNQLRLWFSVFPHLIMSTVQAEVLKGTELASASIGQVRLRLFKIAARLKISVRRIHIELCSAYPRGVVEARPRPNCHRENRLRGAFARNIASTFTTPRRKSNSSSTCLRRYGGFSAVELEELYQDVILDHSRLPRNYGELPGAGRRRLSAFFTLCRPGRDALGKISSTAPFHQSPH